MICARRAEWLDETLEEFRARNFNIEGRLCDVSNPEEVQSLVDETVKTFGKVDILVNNAGISWGAMPEEMPLDKWQKVLDVNLTGAFLFAKAPVARCLNANTGALLTSLRRQVLSPAQMIFIMPDTPRAKPV
jgi:gluconate 5-dehydrogenase